MEKIYKLNLQDDHEEIQPRGCFEFPLSVYENILLDYEEGYLELHWHNDLQFVYVMSGSCFFRVNEKEIFLSQGMGLFINSECLHSAKSFEKNALCVHIIFNPSMIAGTLGSVIDLKYVTPLIKSSSYPYIIFSPTVPWQKRVLNHLYSIQDMSTDGTQTYELDIIIQLLHIWKLIYDNINHVILAKSDFDKDNYERIKIILSYIHANYKRRLSLEEIANQIYVSKTECCKYFKEIMHCTIFTYINEYRLRQSAYALLNSPDCSISEIAYDYGFGSASSYIEKFRRKTGITPLKYRKKFCD